MFKAWSHQPFPRYEVSHEPGDDMCTVVFYTAVHTVSATGGDVVYCADILCLTVAYKSDILDDIRNNYTEWLMMAISDNIKSVEEAT